MSPRAPLLSRLAALCLLLCLPVPAPAAHTLVLNTDCAPPHARPDGTGFDDRIAAEAFRRIGVPVRLLILPSERGLRNSNQGIDDGNYVRVSGLETLYPNLVMVPEPMSTYPFTAFTRDPALALGGWADLQGHQVAYVTGWKLVERNIRGLKDARGVRDEEALFALLDKGRVEIIVASLHTGQEIIRRKGYRGMHAVLPSLATRPMYIYLHKRHAELVPRLAEALRQMRSEGVMERLTRAGLGEARP